MDYNDINRYIEIVLKSNSFLIDNIIPDYLTASDLKYLLSCLITPQTLNLKDPSSFHILTSRDI